MRAILGLAAAALLAGCFTPPEGAEPGATPNWRVDGSFDANATQADHERASTIVSGHGGTMQLLESFPVQFSASGLTAGACDAVRAALAQQPHIARVGDCTATGVA